MSQGESAATCPEGHRVPRRYTASEGCSTCRSRVALGEAARLLVALEPKLDKHSARAAIESVASSTRQRQRLVEWLASHPNRLCSGSSDAAPCDTRLLVALAERGIEVTLPTCLDCGRTRPLVKKVEGGRVCQDCDKRRCAEPCAGCGKVKIVASRAPDGRALCYSCRQLDPSTWRSCGRCGEVAAVISVEDGVSVGSCCYVQPILRCTVSSWVRLRRWERSPKCSFRLERAAWRFFSPLPLSQVISQSPLQLPTWELPQPTSQMVVAEKVGEILAMPPLKVSSASLQAQKIFPG